MKKIICLIDYTRPYDNLIRYAAQLAHDTKSKLVLTSVQQHAAKSNVMALTGEDEELSPDESRLSETCDRVRGVWMVPCDYHYFPHTEIEVDDFLKSDVQLIVAGIESSTNTTPDRIFSNTNFKMLKETHVPILLVPDHFAYHRLNRILYAFDYVHETNPPVESLQYLAEWLQVDVRILSVVQNQYSPEEEEKMDGKNAEIIARWRSKHELSFDSIYYIDVTRCLDHYLNLWKADDMIVFSVRHASIAQKLFHKSIIKQMTICSDYPIMIIRS